MVDHATAKYLNDNIGGVLAKALAEMSVVQPTDGVDFLAQWLKTYAEQEEAKNWRDKEEKALEEERAKTKAKLDEKEAKLQKKQAEIERKEAKFQNFMKKMSDPDTRFDESCWAELVDVAKTFSDAQSVYLGKLDEEGIDGVDGKCICYTHASPGSEWMVDRVLKDGVGVSWSALTENPSEEVPHLWRPPKPEPPAPAEGDGEAEPPPEEPPIPYLPVSVPCVTDVPEMTYFEMTRLGAYLAVPLVYSSYYTPDALADATQFETEKKEAQKAAEEAAAVAAAAAEAEGEAGGGENEEQPPAEEVPEKQMVLRGTPVKMLLCMDTLGTNTAIQESKVADIMELVKACAKCKEQTETAQVDAQALFVLNEQERQALGEETSKSALIAEVRNEVATALQETQEEEEQALEEDDQRELLQEKYKYLRARDTFMQAKDIVLELATWVVIPQEVLNLLAATAYMYGYPKEKVLPKQKSILKWEPLKAILTGDLFKVVHGDDVCKPKKGVIPEHKMASIKELASANGMDEEKAKEMAPAFEVIWALLQAAFAYRGKDLELRRAAFNSRKEAAEAAEETFTETPLEELDDDFVDA